MASVKISDFQVIETPITLVGQSSDGTLDSDIRAIKHHANLVNVLGSSLRHTLLISSATTSRSSFFHSGCVFDPVKDELWTTSAPLQTTSSSSLPVVLISKIALELEPGSSQDLKALTWQKLRPPPNMLMPAGGSLYQGGVMWAAQGVLAANTAGAVHMKDGKMPEVIAKGYHGHEFNSPYDLAVSKDAAIWLTDPYMSPPGEWRPKPVLPQQVYRVEPGVGEVRAMADGLYRPTGIGLSSDETTLYVADAGPDEDSETSASLHVGGIYAFDIISRANAPFLANRRLFSKSLEGSPTCVKCDGAGNVYVAAGKQLEIWTEGGTLLGAIKVPTTVMSFSFGRLGDIFICAGQTLWRIQSSKPE